MVIRKIASKSHCFEACDVRMSETSIVRVNAKVQGRSCDLSMQTQYCYYCTVVTTYRSTVLYEWFCFRNATVTFFFSNVIGIATKLVVPSDGKTLVIVSLRRSADLRQYVVQGSTQHSMLYIRCITVLSLLSQSPRKSSNEPATSIKCTPTHTPPD
jgi:hypothetical protein